ncbi:MAG: GGDEF domain-containing protein [Treponema sp.]|nr:GGDEF domain-containing protein [Treponema sp.]
MKKIGVLVHALTVEYALEVLNGIFAYFSDKQDVQFFVAQTKEPNTDTGYYEYQSWNGVSLLFATDVDLVIVITGSYSSTVSTDNLGKILMSFREKPIISVGADLKIPGSSYIITECDSAYENVVHHLKEKHGCKKIAYFAANKTGSKESLMRFEAFKKGLEKNKLKFYPELVYDGDFSLNVAYKVLEKKYPKKEDVNFDAILCVNDLTALGCQKYLIDLGLNVPEAVKIIGFDDSTYATQSHPRLSTMNQNIYIQGKIAAELAYKKLNGEVIPAVTSVPVEPLYKQSCGCIPLENNDDIYINSDDKLGRPNDYTNSLRKMSGQYLNTLSSIESLYRLLDLAQTSETLHHFANTLDKILVALDIPSCLVCFYKKPVMHEQGKEFILPRNAYVAMMIDTERKVHDYDPGIEFNPTKSPFPPEYFNGYPGSFMLHPLFSGRKNYGYIVCKLKTSNYSMHSVSVKILINTIASNYEYTRSLTKNKSLSKINIALQQSNSNLDLQSKTDELTGILNRRGFMELGQKTLNLAAEAGKHGVLYFADLDGLKKINDTYGHDMGDEAIKAAAHVFSQALRSNDIVGRLSGDEFASIAIGMKLTHERKFRDKVKSLCSMISKDKKFPFTLSVSLGAIEFDLQDNKEPSLSELLSLADEKLYIEKRRKHAKK